MVVCAQVISIRHLRKGVYVKVDESERTAENSRAKFGQLSTRIIERLTSCCQRDISSRTFQRQHAPPSLVHFGRFPIWDPKSRADQQRCAIRRTRALRSGVSS